MKIQDYLLGSECTVYCIRIDKTCPMLSYVQMSSRLEATKEMGCSVHKKATDHKESIHSSVQAGYSSGDYLGSRLSKIKVYDLVESEPICSHSRNEELQSSPLLTGAVSTFPGMSAMNCYVN